MTMGPAYVEESGIVAVLIDSIQQVRLLEEQPACRCASDGIVGYYLEAGPVEVGY